MRQPRADRQAAALRVDADDTDAQTVSLADYIGRMKEGQDAIYYITADSFAAAQQQPAPRDLPQEGHRGAAAVRPRRRVGRVDLHRVRRQAAAVGGQGRSRSRASSAGEADEAGSRDRPARTTSRSLERMQAALKDRASDVRDTDRLTDSPACLVGDEHGMSTNLERMLKAAGQKVPESKPMLEINPEPPARQAAEERDRRDAVRRLEPHPVRPGDAGRGRPARGSRGVRQAAQRADADAGRRRTLQDLDAFVKLGVGGPWSDGDSAIAITPIDIPKLRITLTTRASRRSGRSAAG